MSLLVYLSLLPFSIQTSLVVSNADHKETISELQFPDEHDSLYILDTKIVNLQTFTIFNKRSLKQIQIVGNEYLQQIGKYAILDLPNLMNLTITDNRDLTFLHPLFIRNVDNLELLDLRRNNILHFSDMTMQNLPLFTKIELAHNPYHCGCDISTVLQNRLITLDADLVKIFLKNKRAVF